MFLFKIFLPVFFTGLILSGCKKDEDEDDNKTPQELIVGTWTLGTPTYSVMIGTKTLVQWLKDEMDLSDTEAQMFAQMINAAIEEEMGAGSGTVTIKSDGTYTANMDGDDDSGTWSLSADGKKVTIDSDSGDPMIFDVVTLTSSKLAMKMTETMNEDLNDDDVPEQMTVSVTMNFTK